MNKLHPWVAFIIGTLSLMGLINISVLFIAFRTQQPLIEASPYEQGLAYQQTIDLTSEFARLGLKRHVEFLPHPNPEVRIVSVRLEHSDGSPYDSAEVSLELRYPADAAFDQDIALQEESAGLYRAQIRFRPGVWLIKGFIHRNDSKLIFTNRL